MKNRWTDDDARAAIAQWGPEHSEALALRVYTAKQIGREPDLVLHGGGNASVKGSVRGVLGDEIEAVFVKASGADMAALVPGDLPAMELARLRPLRTLDQLDDDAMVNEIRRALMDSQAPTPSIETLLHAFLPHRFVDHSHADAVLCLTNQPDGERMIREALGDRVAIVPYVKPGFALAKLVADAVERQPAVEGVVLIQHGLITFGDDARTSYTRHIDVVEACERFIAAKSAGQSVSVSFRCDEPPAVLAARIAPMLRGLLAEPTGDEDRPDRPMVLEWRGRDELLGLVNSTAARRLAESGPLTGDHLIRTKRRALYVEQPAWADPAGLREQLHAAVKRFREAYRTYLRTHGGSADSGDLSPRVVLLPGAGVFCWGPTKQDACIAADIAGHTLAVKHRAERIESYVSLSDDRLFEMEFRGLQRAKLRTHERALTGRIVAVSGGAGAIGSAIAEVCAEAGAHVAVTDLDGERAAEVSERIAARLGAGAAAGFAMDVTDERSVRDAFGEIARTFGGVDVVVPNAGIAHVAPIDQIDVADFRRVMEVNATGCLLFMREGIRLLKEQGIGGNVVLISSKNVPAPGKEFAAYSASKAAAHQLGRVAAIECAPFGIRVNMIAPDAVFGGPESPSGLWETVGPARAKSRNLDPGGLADYYRQRSLLKVRVTGRHVGNAVVFFATHQTPTTGASLPVDAGLPEAFPR